MKILFVCLGNICRSPMAEFIFRNLLIGSGLQEQIYVASAATSNEEYGNPVYPPAARMLLAHGIDPKGKTARRMTKRDYDEYDMIVAMDTSNIQNIKAITGGDPLKKVSLLLDHTPASDTMHHHRSVADPWYTGDFEAAWEDINAGCRALLKEIIGE